MYVGYVMVCSKMVNVPEHEQLFQGFFWYPSFGESDTDISVFRCLGAQVWTFGIRYRSKFLFSTTIYIAYLWNAFLIWCFYVIIIYIYPCMYMDSPCCTGKPLKPNHSQLLGLPHGRQGTAPELQQRVRNTQRLAPGGKPMVTIWGGGTSITTLW